MSDSTSTTSALRRNLGPFQLLTMGVGAIMGVGWAIVLGDWLSSAAPLGAIAGFVAGGLLMLLIAGCYGELATIFPQAGGDVIYTREVFGRAPAFCVGWFLVLMAISITSFEAIAFAWFGGILAPNFKGAVAYRLFDHDVDYGALIIATAFISLIALVNYRGVHQSSRLQDLSTLLKGIAIVAFIIAAFATGSVSNLAPVTTPILDRPAWLGALWIAATAPVWFGGFQVVPQAIEERSPRTTPETVARMTMLSVAFGIVFYCAVVLSASSVMPWRTLVAEPLPAVASVRAAFGGGTAATLVLAAIAVGMLATWNACFFWATHLLLAMGRLGLAPAWLSHTNAHGVPGRAILFVAIVGFAGVFLGRGGLIPIVNMATIALALSYAICCAALLRLRLRDASRPRPYKMPGGFLTLGLAVAASAAMGLVAFFEPLSRTKSWPLEWTLLLAWGVVGAAVWCLNFRQRPTARAP